MHRHLKTLVTLLILMSSTALADTSGVYRIADGVEPSFQAITLKLDPNQVEFSGSTSIEVTVTRSVEQIGRAHV